MRRWLLGQWLAVWWSMDPVWALDVWDQTQDTRRELARARDRHRAEVLERRSLWWTVARCRDSQRAQARRLRERAEQT